MQIVDSVQRKRHAFKVARNIRVIAKVDTVLTKDSEFTTFKEIFSESESTDPLSIYITYNTMLVFC